MLSLLLEFEGLVEFDQPTPGREQLALLRKAAGCDLPISKVEKGVQQNKYHCAPKFLLVTEKMAEKSGHFLRSGETKITVLPTAECWTERPVVVTGPNGKVLSARIKWAFDEEKFLALWGAKGFPWEIGGDEE